jgi:hypothetical protein
MLALEKLQRECLDHKVINIYSLGLSRKCLPNPGQAVLTEEIASGILSKAKC